MDNFLKRVYVMEVKSQATFATHAIMDLNESLKNLGDVHGNRRIHSEVFRQTHSFLTHASNVSRLFWPPRLNKKKMSQQKTMRKDQLSPKRVAKHYVNFLQ